MDCPNCGTQIPDESVYCQKCGYELNAGTTASGGEGQPVPAAAAVKSIEELKSIGYQVNIGEYIGRGWEIFSSNIGGFIGYYVIVGILSIFLALVPFFGGLASAVLAGPLRAGFFIVSFKKMKNQKVEFGDFFTGFNYFLPLFLFTFISGIFIILGLILLIIPGLYLAIAYSFALPIIIDRKLDFWEAMEASRQVVSKKWFSVFALVFILGLINFGGVLLLLVGVLFTGPLTVCAQAAAYEDIFGLESNEF